VLDVDQSLDVDEVGIPEDWAKNLTIPINITSFNIKKMEKLVNDGKAKIVIRDDIRLHLDKLLWTKGFEIMDSDRIIKNGVQFDPYKYELIKGKKWDFRESLEKNGISDNYKVKRIITMANGQKKRILLDAEPKKKKYFKLRLNDIVERYVVNGDIALVNRQPTLHQGSAFGLKIVILPGKAIRLNVSAMGTLNADC